MEEEQTADDHGGNKFLDVHMYITAALQRTDMRAVALQTAIDILHKKVELCYNQTLFQFYTYPDNMFGLDDRYNFL